MKKQFIIISVLFITATAFTLLKPIDHYDEMRKNVVQQLFVSELNMEYYDISGYPDTTLVFTKPQNQVQYYSGKYTLKSLNGIGATGTIWAISQAVPSDVRYVYSSYNDVFKEKFGVAIHGKSVKMANKYDGIHEEFLFYNPKGMKVAFDKLYLKPTNSFEKYSYQKIYNLAAKAYVRDLTKYFAYIMSKKTAFVQASTQYLTSAKTNKNFNTYKESEIAFKKIFPTEASRKQFPNMIEEVDYYDFGSIIRRQCDGTLPTILACLKTVLKDYDPEALKLIKGTF
jgi:hypothetical protein